MQKVYSLAVLMVLLIVPLLTAVGCGGSSAQSTQSPSGGGTPTSGTSSGGGTPPALADISGKWEFANGINLNLTQVNSEVTGNDVYQTVFNSPPNPSNMLLIEPCSPNSVTGNVSALTVMLQSGNCDIAPSGGYSTTTTANATGTLLSGGAWGDAFKVGSVTRTYSGMMNFSGGINGASTASLTLTEDQNHNLVGTLVSANGANLGQMTGQAIGGAINLGGGTVAGIVEIGGGINTSVTGEGYVCGGNFCALIGNGVLQ